MAVRKTLSIKSILTRKQSLIGGFIFAVCLTVLGDIVLPRLELFSLQMLHKLNAIQLIISWVAFFIGNELRKWLMPDAVYTRKGFFGLLGTQLFWMFGPQTIGGIAGWIFPLVLKMV